MSICMKQESQSDVMSKEVTDIIGRIECAENNAITGWAVSLTGEQVDLRVLIDGLECEATIERRERLDVVEKYGDAARMCGFSITPSLKHVVLDDLLKNDTASVEVVGNATSLQWYKGGSTKVKEKIKLLGSYVDSVRDFSIKGWALREDGLDCKITVVVNGHKIECPTISVERQDVARAFGANAFGVGFEIILPGCIWELRDANDICSIEVYADEVRVNSESILLGTNDLLKWVNSVFELESVNENEYIKLLALEHVKFSEIYDSLKEPLRNLIAGYAEKTQLDEFVIPPRKSADGSRRQPESISTLMLRNAMLELNSRLAAAENSVYPLVRDVYKKHALRGAAKEWYLNLAIQLTCAHDEFELLNELTDFRYLDSLESSRQPHQLALLLPVLVTNGRIEKATDVMKRVAKYINNSWLPSECVSYAVKYVHKLELEGAVDIHAAEMFRNAFLNILDGFKGGWFSRLHDKVLVQTMVELIGECELYTDYHKRALISAALRHYGLSPVFWGVKSGARPELEDRELSYAESSWGVIRTFLDKKEEMSTEGLAAVIDALEFFKNKGNVEAVSFMREIAINSINELRDVDVHMFSTLLRRLVLDELSDEIRIGAHPVPFLGSEKESFCRNGSGVLHSLRLLGEYHKSAVYDMQVAAAKSLERMSESYTHTNEVADHDLVKQHLSGLERRCALLGTWQGMFLGADMLLSGYQICAAQDYRPGSVIMNAGEMIRSAVGESEKDDALPAPICAALGRISADDNDENLKCFSREMHGVVRARYGNRYDNIFKTNPSHDFSLDAQGWPKDTLVVIDTTKTQLNKRVSALRETWLKELKRREISYIFVTGEGRNELSGDLLELDISDCLVEKPQKALKLFEWVLQHTNAQYVVKVNDKCFLDVERYFNTLSYRKYHYYGKVVSTGNRKIDRMWHQSFVGDEVASKSIDKSMTNSTFVSGRLACSFSRFAITEVCDAAKSASGKRLLVGTCCEDKAIGELLSMKKITAVDEDFDSYSDSCATHEIMPTEVQGRSFYPGLHTPGKVAYCQHGDGIREVYKKRQEGEIWPKKIWPTYQGVSLKKNSNQLELLTERTKLQELLKEELVVVSVVRNEMLMLPQFFEHYRNLGAKCFIFVDNCSDDGTRDYLRSQPDTIVYSADTEYRYSHYGVSWQQSVLGNHCLGKWVLLADADEFLVYEDSESVQLSDFIKGVEELGDDGVLLYMIDMYPYGDLKDAKFDEGHVFNVAPYFDKEALIELRFGGGMYSNSRNYVNGLRHRIAPSRINAYVSQKYALFKYFPWVRLCEGVHYAANINVSEKRGFFAHFKYHCGFKEKVESEVKRKQHFNGAEEYQKYAEMLAEISGGFGVDGVSERYIDSHSFVQLLERLR